MAQPIDWQAKISKLMANAEDDRLSPAARDAFLSKANELIEKFKIEWVKKQNYKPDVQIEEITFDITQETHGIKYWRYQVLQNVARLFYCEALKVGSVGASLIGTAQDIDLAKQVFERVVQFVEQQYLMQSAIGRAEGIIGNGSDKINGQKWKADFYSGAASELNVRCREMLDARKTGRHLEEETALVVIQDETEQAINNFLSNKNLGTYRSKNRAVSEHGYFNGKRAGASAPLHNELKDES